MLETVVIPVAGFGSRLYPYSKVIPKEMVLVCDKPLIQHSILEAIKAGFKRAVLVYRSETTKRYLELLQATGALPGQIDIVWMRDEVPRGVARGILLAEKLIDEEFFGVSFPDDFLLPNDLALSMLRSCCLQNRGFYLLLTPVDSGKESWGMAQCSDPPHNSLGSIRTVLAVREKPRCDSTRYGYGIIARYVLHTSIFEAIRRADTKVEGELNLTDCIQTHIACGTPPKVYGFITDSLVFDCGTFDGIAVAGMVAGAKNGISQRFYCFDTDVQRKTLRVLESVNLDCATT